MFIAFRFFVYCISLFPPLNPTKKKLQHQLAFAWLRAAVNSLPATPNLIPLLFPGERRLEGKGGGGEGLRIQKILECVSSSLNEEQRLAVYLYIYIYICIYICVYTYMHIYICMYICVCIYIHIYTHVYIYIFMCVYI